MEMTPAAWTIRIEPGTSSWVANSAWRASSGPTRRISSGCRPVRAASTAPETSLAWARGPRPSHRRRVATRATPRPRPRSSGCSSRTASRRGAGSDMGLPQRGQARSWGAESAWWARRVRTRAWDFFLLGTAMAGAPVDGARREKRLGGPETKQRKIIAPRGAVNEGRAPPPRHSLGLGQRLPQAVRAGSTPCAICGFPPPFPPSSVAKASQDVARLDAGLHGGVRGGRQQRHAPWCRCRPGR